MNHLWIDIHTHHPTDALTIRTVGVHPWQALTAPLPSGDMVAAADAVGEIGLDKVCGSDFRQQEQIFAAQLDLAERFGKPVIIHCVRAFDEVIHQLRGRQLPAVIFHGFIGSKEQAARALQSGYYLSFGVRTGHSPKSIEALRIVPLDRLFIETDDSQTPITACYAQVAAWRGIEVETLQRACRENYERLFPKRV